MCYPNQLQDISFLLLLLLSYYINCVDSPRRTKSQCGIVQYYALSGPTGPAGVQLSSPDFPQNTRDTMGSPPVGLCQSCCHTFKCSLFWLILHTLESYFQPIYSRFFAMGTLQNVCYMYGCMYEVLQFVPYLRP